MELDKEREILKEELEKTTGVVSSSSSSKEPSKKVGVGIRTYSADIADIMRREKGSIIKIALAEQARQKEGKESRDPTSTRNIIIIFIGIAFIVSGIMIFIYTALDKQTSNNAVVMAPIVPGLIYTENQTQTDITNLTRGNLFNTISNSSDASFAENKTMVNIFLTNASSLRSQISVLVFFDKLGIKIPENLKASLTGEFMLGSFKVEDKGNLFLILKVKDYNESFVAMKDWEVSMANDLVRLFKINPQSFTGDIFLLPFRDRVLYNKEMRGLYDEDGRLVVSYTYIDRNTIIITSHTPSVEEIIKRINSQSIR
ncbi:MAG: hypothetical protein QG580_185 [Patescibacteria group bacterium]|jgi:hypothetical protein|nr:hypothetical protein [Patescibacteria group bacterium]